MPTFFSIVEQDKLVSTLNLHTVFQLNINLDNETAENHEINYTLDDITNALVVKGPSQKTQKANITLTTSDSLSTAVDTGANSLAEFPKDAADIQFGSTGVATTFMTAILAATGSTGTTSALTVGDDFVLQDGATGIPQNCGGATFTRTNNEVEISGVEITEIVLGSNSDLHYRVTGPSFGTITLTLDGIAFTTKQIGSVTDVATELATQINANAKYDATSSAGVISVELPTHLLYDVFINNSSSTNSNAGTTNFSIAFADTTDNWRKLDGSAAKPSAYAILGAPLYDGDGVTIAVDVKVPNAGLLEMTAVLNVFWKDAANGASSSIRAKGFVMQVIDSSNVVVHQSDASVMTAVEVTESGSFSVYPTVDSRIDFTYRLYNPIKDIDYDSHTHISTAKYQKDDGTWESIPHTTGQTLSIRSLTDTDVRNCEPIFQPYKK